MTRKLAALGAIVALGVLMMGATVPTASAGGQEITFRAITREATNLDLGDEGPSQGDAFIFHDVLKKNGEIIGHDGGVCTVTSVRRQEFQCLVTASLEGGQIVIAGLNRETGDMPEDLVFAVTGGTGQYQGASGEAHVLVKSETIARVTITLLPA
jgi:hypothetical protein